MSTSEAAAGQVKILREGTVDLITESEFESLLAASLKEKRPLRVKYGADPSSPDLHLGHTVPLRKLRQFQELGHTVVFIIGDFTARIGDPSERSATRPMLTPEIVKKNSETYQKQVFKILDKNKTEVRYNSEWLDKMSPADFLHLTLQYTVARLLERDDFAKRFKASQPIALIEFLYPLLQGYDSVEVRSDIEIGGTDQKFNLLVGRELQKIWKQTPQIVLTLPLLEGTDGTQKMSKSLGNAIGIEESPKEMFGKIMSVPDKIFPRYIEYVSALPSEKVKKLIQEFSARPREVKAELGERIVTLYHGESEGKRAREEFDRVFRDKGLPDDIPTVKIAKSEIDIVSLLRETQLVASNGEARRLIEQGGVRLDQVKVSDEKLVVKLSKPVLLQCGKRKFTRVEYEK